MTGEGMFDMDAKGASSITVIDDEDGMLLLGDQLEIDRVLAGRGLVTKGIDAKTLLKLGKGVTELSEHASRSGQWVKLTKESSEALVKYGKTGMQSGVLRGTDGKIIQHLKFMNPGELANPALAAGVGGMMAQYALEQAIEEITDYLKSIDGKLDDLLQDQKDRMAADLGGVARLVDETYAIKREVGVVSDVTWSKVDGCGKEAAAAQCYVLEKLNGLARKLEHPKGADALLETAKKAAPDVTEWLVLLARAVKIQDQLSAIELDRVMASQPELVEDHRRGIRAARRDRLGRIEREIDGLGSCMERAARKIGADRLRLIREVPLFERESDVALDSLREAQRLFSGFAASLDLHIESHPIESAPEWGDAVGELAGDVADGARELGGHIADKAQDLGGNAVSLLHGIGGALRERLPTTDSARESVDGGEKAAEGSRRKPEPKQAAVTFPKLPFGTSKRG